MSTQEPTVEDAICVLLLAAKWIAKRAGLIEQSNSWKPIEIVERAKSDWASATFDQGVSECDSWLRLHEKIATCKACNGKGSLTVRRSSGGCSGDHWGDCTRDCLPYGWTEYPTCGECDATGKNKNVTSVLGCRNERKGEDDG